MISTSTCSHLNISVSILPTCSITDCTWLHVYTACSWHLRDIIDVGYVRAFIFNPNVSGPFHSGGIVGNGGLNRNFLGNITTTKLRYRSHCYPILSGNLQLIFSIQYDRNFHTLGISSKQYILFFRSKRNVHHLLLITLYHSQFGLPIAVFCL